MWLGDDDWIDSSYVAECLSELINNPDTVLTGGLARYYFKNKFHHTGTSTNLIQERRLDRLLGYYHSVEENGIYYGLWQRSDLVLLPIVNTMGTDWLTLAAAAYSGKIRTVPITCIHRELGGSSASFGAMVEQMQLANLQEHFPYFSIAVNAAYDVLLRAWPFNELPLHTRIYVAFRVFYKLVTRYVIRRALIDAVIGVRKRILRARS